VHYSCVGLAIKKLYYLIKVFDLESQILGYF
jgi:hypothetical protein